MLAACQKTCEKFLPVECPIPLAPNNGGLVCVTIDSKRYCKPMCNQGYDFTFLRKSQPYEQCGADTKKFWTTQYIGGNMLAVCAESSIAVSGISSAYFPKDCQTALFNYTMQEEQVGVFLQELNDEKIIGNHMGEYDCLLCGSQVA
ncbi:uncharacterized protein SI:CH1073-126C3.2 [Latimeria chalumnae]|uniref:uncharacterized protein SI:CH1073-126C3.2 n=1 Tax=Latimeria chalumnae TaxID=7897 RepID=UPI00313E154E